MFALECSKANKYIVYDTNTISFEAKQILVTDKGDNVCFRMF
jgi:hypothetical protein